MFFSEIHMSYLPLKIKQSTGKVKSVLHIRLAVMLKK